MAKPRPESCKAARHLLGWTQADLARRVGVSAAAIKKFEVGRTPLLPATRAAIERAFEEAGVRLLGEEDGGLGAQLRRPL